MLKTVKKITSKEILPDYTIGTMLLVAAGSAVIGWTIGMALNNLAENLSA